MILHFLHRRRYFFVLAFILALSFFLRLPFVFSDRLWPDEALYAWYAKNIFLNPWNLFSPEISQFHPPLFASLLALGHFFLPSLPACQTIAFAMGLLGIWGIGLWGIRIHSGFTGCLAALLLALNPIYTQYSTKILTDATLMVFLLGLAAMLGKVREDGQTERGESLKIGAMSLLTILLKWTGVLVVPWLAVYYAWGLRGEARKKLFPALGIVVMGILFLALHSAVRYGRMIPYGGSALWKASSAESPFFYVQHLPEIAGGAFLLPFAFWGMVVTFIKQRKLAILLLAWFLVFLIPMSCVAEKLLRYSLLILPPILLWTAMGMEDVLRRCCRSPRFLTWGKMAVSVILVVVCGVTYPRLQDGLREDGKYFKGFPEAGAWVEQHTTAPVLLPATSERAMRYCADVRIGDKGKGVEVVSFPQDKHSFESIANNFPGTVIVELDNWGDPGRLKFDPFDPQQEKYFQSLGFSVAATFGQLRYNDNGHPRIAPAIWLFERKGR